MSVQLLCQIGLGHILQGPFRNEEASQEGAQVRRVVLVSHLFVLQKGLDCFLDDIVEFRVLVHENQEVGVHEGEEPDDVDGGVGLQVHDPVDQSHYDLRVHLQNVLGLKALSVACYNHRNGTLHELEEPAFVIFLTEVQRQPVRALLVQRSPPHEVLDKASGTQVERVELRLLDQACPGHFGQSDAHPNGVRLMGGLVMVADQFSKEDLLVAAELDELLRLEFGREGRPCTQSASVLAVFVCALVVAGIFNCSLGLVSNDSL